MTKRIKKKGYVKTLTYRKKIPSMMVYVKEK